ncbi:phasin family protein [Azohydromonas australica]|uniref:phasin family protein n=1 Tax=Azohydromonas australica TaxID=364039 RepID=UPI00040B3740|nr:phasin family protein [Azohydromonas australica]
MSTSPQRATSPRSPRTPLAAATEATLEHSHGAAINTPLGASANEARASSEATLDEVINGWGERVGREQLRWHLAAINAMLSGTQHLGEAQAELSRQVMQGLQQLDGELGEARNLSDLASVQASLARADFDALLRFATRLTELGTDQWLQVAQATGNGLLRLQSAYWESALNFFKLQAALGGSSEMIEAEVEHVLSPMAASPLMWPAQEAGRQVAQMAANGWNDWLSWSGHVADAGRTLFNDNTRKH